MGIREWWDEGRNYPYEFFAFKSPQLNILEVLVKMFKQISDASSQLGVKYLLIFQAPPNVSQLASGGGDSTPRCDVGGLWAIIP